jgi:hypothetical protein
MIAVRDIVNDCQHLKKFSLGTAQFIGEDDVIHVIKRLGK